ncbi:hypothetical protein TNCV_2885951 [Trichonephila clavipes]|nr:hypothetical protein TNCV_2885951 [Trichonephila clavipes]
MDLPLSTTYGPTIIYHLWIHHYLPPMDPPLSTIYGPTIIYHLWTHHYLPPIYPPSPEMAIGRRKKSECHGLVTLV